MCYVSGLASCTIGLVNISDSAFGLTSVNRPHRIDTKYTKSTAEKTEGARWWALTKLAESGIIRLRRDSVSRALQSDETRRRPTIEQCCVYGGSLVRPTKRRMLLATAAADAEFR